MLMKNNLSRVTVISFLLLLITSFISPAAVKAYTKNIVPVLRISGADRYATAAAVSREGWNKSEYILLATGEGTDKFSDALAGSTLSYALNAPVLLTTPDKLSYSTQNEIVRLKAKKAVILGGSSVVSDNVEKKLRSMGLETERLWGYDRNLTAIRIAEKLRSIKYFSEVFLTSGDEFQYAMMIAPYASRNGKPVLFTEKDALNPQVKDFLLKWGVDEVHIIGNTTVISQAVEDSLENMKIAVSRVSGMDAADTNIKVINTYKMDLSHIALARNDVFADGLAGVSFAALKNIPILLTGAASAPQYVSNFLENSSSDSAYIFGGFGAVSDYIITLIRKGDSVSHIKGNTIGNINSGGLAITKDGWTYYNNVNEGGKLYKARIDGTEKTELCSDIPAHINVIEDRIYYTNLSDNSKIYMIRTDGTRKTKINDDDSWNITVCDNWIYYINLSDGGYIYKISTDGAGKQKLNDCNSKYMSVTDDYIYYANADDDHMLNSMEIGNPSIVHKYANIFTLGLDSDNSWIYFSNSKDNFRLYAANPEGTEIRKLSDDSAFDIQVLGDTIFYSNASDGDKLYKIKTDGTGRTVVYGGSTYLLNTAGDWIYFFKDKEGTKLYKIMLDGTGLMEVG